MKVLVAVVSKHGSTMGIGEAIAVELRSMNIETDVRDVTELGEVSHYDAAIVGSAVYMGRWMPEAVAFVRNQEATLQTMPVWLFSSGPLGDEPKPPGDPQRLDELMGTARARGHRIFSGRLDKDYLGLGERLIVKAAHAPIGDFRDWDAIRDWAKEIGESLRQNSAGIGRRPAA